MLFGEHSEKDGQNHRFNVGPNAATQPWVPTPLTDLFLIRKAASESGPDSPYFEQCLSSYNFTLESAGA
ncbi:hypothetical protein STEG23_021418, partial [Scotinomys teguina]